MFTEFQFLAAQQLLKKLYETCCEPIFRQYGLTRMELDVLMILAEKKDIETAGELSARLGFTKSHVSKAVESLSRRGLLNTCPDSVDHRRVCLQICDAAKPIISEGFRAQRKLADYLYQGMDEREQKQFDTYLVRAVKAAQMALAKESEEMSNGTV
ncbi:MarR family winged helix-turn-helix transcriptional regulator [uncultured Ruthenibacterium sp.]|uniref:MarR family winged helix-turn-helix transcriptional regulator n=1 Tax=uncultured Ruthenibacterium sp. TaxID=1905347 RepID=UPI00349E80E3